MSSLKSGASIVRKIDLGAYSYEFVDVEDIYKEEMTSGTLACIICHTVGCVEQHRLNARESKRKPDDEEVSLDPEDYQDEKIAKI